jgi:hypothetical protein
MTKELTPQAKLTLEHLLTREGHGLTPLMASIRLGITSISSCIRELRRAGHGIADRWKVDNHGRMYKEYWLELKKDLEE